LNFTKEISLKNISFKYPKTQKFILNNISLTIKKGISIGIIGPSGEGKSTLIDVILGLLPTNGEILVDGVNIKENIPSWYKNISYMPQSVYLTDDTIKRNIAFGIKDEDIDENL
jgi:ABC-type multidrug transport system fused ATPase/permease subunit